MYCNCYKIFSSSHPFIRYAKSEEETTPVHSKYISILMKLKFQLSPYYSDFVFQLVQIFVPRVYFLVFINLPSNKKDTRSSDMKFALDKGAR